AVDAYFENCTFERSLEALASNPNQEAEQITAETSPFECLCDDESEQCSPSAAREHPDEVAIIDNSPPRKMSAGEPKKFATLFDNAESKNDDNEMNNRQAFYVGGGDKSGQEVLGPERPPANAVENFFRRARNLGAQEFEPSSSQEEHVTSHPSFTGIGHKLDGSVVSQENKAEDKARPVETVRLQMWRNGFSINDEQLRPYDGRENKQFLEEVMKGVIPSELVRRYPGAEISLEMENRHQEDYEETEEQQHKVIPFSGQGFVLGNPCPSVTGAGEIGVKLSPKAPAKSGAEPPKIVLDPGVPTTNVTVRLVDGSRLVLH
ncbi:unnamed protein product, partial [Soboliphyme baturini]|uniref:SEP domain-containing protein n=1 Tax=Soboliphyme baturini TaxID=241478 RepID=A0A183J539_9BILA